MVSFDFAVQPHGSVVSFHPLTPRVADWLQANTQAEPWQWFGGALVVDTRFAGDLYDGLRKAGFRHA